jgi:hypothetical protein
MSANIGQISGVGQLSYHSSLELWRPSAELSEHSGEFLKTTISSAFVIIMSTSITIVSILL